MRHFLRHYFRLLLMICGIMEATGQGDDMRPDFLVRVWQSGDGLPVNVVRSLGQTPEGFLWIATAEGVARFDGIDFEKVAPPNDQRGSRLGLFRLFALDDDQVWVSTFKGGLLRVRDMQLERIIEDESEPNPPLVTQLLHHRERIILKRGEKILQFADGKLTSIDSPDPALIQLIERDALRQTDSGRNPAGSRNPRLVDRDGGIWSVEERGSLFYQGPGIAPRKLTLPEIDDLVFVNEILEDREGNIWLATAIQGLVQIRHSRVVRLRTSDGPYKRPITTAIETRDGDWWIARRSSGVDRISGDSLTHLQLEPGGYPRPVTCIFEDSRGRLWFAARDGSVFQWTGEAFEVLVFAPQTPTKVNAIIEDRQGRIWFGGAQGLAKLEDGEFTTFPEVEATHDDAITTLTALPDRGIIAGTANGRVIVAVDDDFSTLGQPEDLDRRWISSILALPHDEIWVATLGSGIFLWKDHQWHRFGSEKGIPDEDVTAIVRHGDDQLWFGSLGGILNTSRTELLLSLTNDRLVPRWLRLDRSDGLSNRECIGRNQPPAWKSANETIWFPTGNGPAGVPVDKLEIRRTPPRVYLKPVKIGGQTYPVSSKPIIAGPGRSRLEFGFAGLSLTAPEKVTYKVRLLGLEPQVRSIGSQRHVSYESVPPGAYQFEVTAVNGDGYESILPATIPIIVNPHFWEAGWFIVTVSIVTLLLALAIGWLVARSRLNRRIQTLRVRGALETERARISRDLHDDLGASLTELSILSALAVENPDTSSLRSTCKQLSSKSKNVVSTLDEIVWAANPREDTLRSLIDYLCAFVREFLENTQIPLRTEIARDIPDRPIGPNRRHNLFLATREAVNNAVKHSEATLIRLQISTDDEFLTVDVEDNGKGFNVEYAESGNGLSNLKKRMTDCGGTATIRSSPQSGCTISLKMPLDQVIPRIP